MFVPVLQMLLVPVLVVLLILLLLLVCFLLFIFIDLNSKTNCFTVAPAVSANFVFNTTAIDIGSFSVGDGYFNWTTVEDDGGNLQISWTIEYSFNPLLSGPYSLWTTTTAFSHNVHGLTIGQVMNLVIVHEFYN